MNETIIGAIIAAIVALITVNIQNHFNKSKNFSDIITRERINTINVMRNLVAEICALLSCVDHASNSINTLNRKNKNGLKDVNYELLKNLYKLKMLLSIHYEKNGNETHLLIEKLINDIIKTIKTLRQNEKQILDQKSYLDIKDKFEKFINEMVKVSKYNFDYEWNRIKNEVGGAND